MGICSDFGTMQDQLIAKNLFDNMDNLTERAFNKIYEEQKQLERKKMESMQGLVKEIFEDKEKYKDVLVFIIQTLDKEFNDEVQNTNNPIGLIRDKIDRVLNK